MSLKKLKISVGKMKICSGCGVESSNLEKLEEVNLSEAPRCIWCYLHPRSFGVIYTLVRDSTPGARRDVIDEYFDVEY